MGAQLSIRPIDWDYRPNGFFDFIDEGLVPAPFNKVAIQPSLWAARFKWDASLEPAEPPRSLAGLAARYWAKHPPAISEPEDQPGRRAREVDIARITIRSTLSDTTSITARRVGSRIRYRIVDEYGGESLSDPRERSSSRPWSLRQFVDFLLRGWDLRAVLWVNFDLDSDDPGKIKRFLSITTSDFYPQFEAAIESRIDEWIADARNDGSLTAEQE